MSQTVVIALDSSDLSERALPFARSIAHRWSGHLVLVHAQKQANDPLDHELTELVKTMRETGISADAVSRVAPPARAIVDVARECNADLIVMASHQRQGLNRWLNGSVTEAVLAETPTPLLVVPALGEVPTAERVRILVPLDGTAVAEAALEFVSNWSATRALDLLLVRVVSYGPIMVGTEPAFTALSPAEIDLEIREARDYLAGLVKTLGDAGVSARHQVIETSGPIANVILETARNEHVDTIAVGTHGKAGVSRLVLGSISEEVLERSTVPVLLVHQRAGVLAGSGAGASRSER